MDKNTINYFDELIRSGSIFWITLWGSGSLDGKGSSTFNVISQFTKSLPALHDIASLAGLELPQYLGKIGQDSLNEITGKVMSKADHK